MFLLSCAYAHESLSPGHMSVQQHTHLQFEAPGSSELNRIRGWVQTRLQPINHHQRHRMRTECFAVWRWGGVECARWGDICVEWLPGYCRRSSWETCTQRCSCLRPAHRALGIPPPRHRHVETLRAESAADGWGQREHLEPRLTAALSMS